MKARLALTVLVSLCVCATAVADEYDYYKHLRYPTKLVPGVGLDKVEQEGGPNVTGYRRRTVRWWPRKGQDIVDIPQGAPLRTWTRNKGQGDKEFQAGLQRNWTASDPDTFDAHLIEFRAFGTSTPMNGYPAHIPVAVVRMEDGRPRAITNYVNHSTYGPITQMVSLDDQEFIHKTWKEAFRKLHAKTTPDPRVSRGEKPDGGFKPYEAVRPEFNAIEWKEGDEFPRYGEKGNWIFYETPNFRIRSE